VVSRVSSVGGAYKTAQIYKTNNTLTFYKNDISYKVPYVVGKVLFDTEDTKKYVEVINTNVYITISNNSTTSLLDINDVISLGRFNYRIVDIDDISKSGLLILKYEKVTTEQEIPTLPSPVTNGVKIIGDTTVTKGFTKDYSCIFYVGGGVSRNTSVFYLTALDGTSTTSVASIETQDGAKNTCTLIGNALGSFKLWVKSSNNSVVSSPLTIEVKKVF